MKFFDIKLNREIVEEIDRDEEHTLVEGRGPQLELRIGRFVLRLGFYRAIIKDGEKIKGFSKPNDFFEPSSRVLDGEDLSGIKGLGLIICIPKTIAENLQLRKGDELTWIDHDSKTNIIRLRLSRR